MYVPLCPVVAVDLAQQFKKGAGEHSSQLFVGVLESFGPHLQAKLSLLAVFSTPFNGRKYSTTGLQGLGSNIPTGSQELADLEEGGSHDPVRKLSLS